MSSDQQDILKGEWLAVQDVMRLLSLNLMRLYLYPPTHTTTYARCHFRRNSVLEGGYGGAVKIYRTQHCAVVFHSCIFDSNQVNGTMRKMDDGGTGGAIQVMVSPSG
jgi:hypothetical protein